MGHKGYGFALASALIGGLSMIDDPNPTLGGTGSMPKNPYGAIGGAFLVVFNPGAFGDSGTYQSLVGDTLDAVKKVPAAPGFSQVLTPGEIEVRTRAQRKKDGIAIPEPIWEDLAKASARFGVPLPENKVG